MELGYQGLAADFNDPDNKVIGIAETSSVTENELRNAIDAHIAGPTKQEVTYLNRQQGLVKLKQLGFTDDEIAALLS